jgi:tRNA modification GTPase
LPADQFVWPGPRSYTGQDVVELHTLSCPPLVELMIGELLKAGARAAQPGEFTMRAFLAGKLDLVKAEAVLAVIEAGNRDELRSALGQLAGGVSGPLQQLRSDLLDLLADVEAGLDFADEDIEFIGQEQLLTRLSKGLALITLLSKQLEQRTISERPFRAVLVGRPNVGKSSLFNALGGQHFQALVSPQPGTTRDYLVQRLELDGVTVELVDTAGWQAADDAIQDQAQTLGREQTQRGDLILLCLEAGRALDETEQSWLMRRDPPVIAVGTKCDLATATADCLPTSAVAGSGLAELRALLTEHARHRTQSGLAPSLSRCRHHVGACLDHLRRAHAVVLYDDPPEILALEVRCALDQLGEMVGAVYTDELLDRIFSRFCVGK